MTMTINRQKAGLIKKYHTLCNQLRKTDEEKREMLNSNYGVTSSKELHLEELKQLCEFLENELNPPTDESLRIDKQRKKLLALIYEFCEASGYDCDKETAKHIACNACGVKYLNQASEQKLIAAIQRFDQNVIHLAVDELVKICIKNK